MAGTGSGLNHASLARVTLKVRQKASAGAAHRRSSTMPNVLLAALALALLRGLLLLQVCHHLLPRLRHAAIGGQSVDQPREHL
jgi:hypothetical protein